MKEEKKILTSKTKCCGVEPKYDHSENCFYCTKCGKFEPELLKERTKMPRIFKFTAYFLLLSLLYKFVANIESIVAYIVEVI